MLMQYIHSPVVLLSILIEFHTNGNWGYNVPVHPKLSFHKFPIDDCQVIKNNLHASSKLQHVHFVPIL